MLPNYYDCSIYSSPEKSFHYSWTATDRQVIRQVTQFFVTPTVMYYLGSTFILVFLQI